jgi:REP element-mobilizing transposase RayT
MSADDLEKVKLLPLDKQQEVEDFVNYLLNKYASASINQEPLAEKRRRNLGRLKGQIWMADDFNDTPEDFKEYL